MAFQRRYKRLVWCTLESIPRQVRCLAGDQTLLFSAEQIWLFSFCQNLRRAFPEVCAYSERRQNDLVIHLNPRDMCWAPEGFIRRKPLIAACAMACACSEYRSQSELCDLRFLPGAYLSYALRGQTHPSVRDGWPTSSSNIERLEWTREDKKHKMCG